MHDQLMAVIARPTCSLAMAVVCRFLRVRRTFNAETVVGMASGLRERLRYLLASCSAIRFIAALDMNCSSKHSAPKVKCAEQMTLLE